MSIRPEASRVDRPRVVALWQPIRRAWHIRNYARLMAQDATALERRGESGDAHFDKRLDAYTASAVIMADAFLEALASELFLVAPGVAGVDKSMTQLLRKAWSEELLHKKSFVDVCDRFLELAHGLRLPRSAAWVQAATIVHELRNRLIHVDLQVSEAACRKRSSSVRRSRACLLRLVTSFSKSRPDETVLRSTHVASCCVFACEEFARQFVKLARIDPGLIL